MLEKHSVSVSEMMVMGNLFGAAFALCACIASGELYPATLYCIEHPHVLLVFIVRLAYSCTPAPVRCLTRLQIVFGVCRRPGLLAADTEVGMRRGDNGHHVQEDLHDCTLFAICFRASVWM